MQCLQLKILLFTFLSSASCSLPKPKYADVTPTQLWYSTGSTVTFACLGEFESGSTTMTCQTDGTWSPAPKCEEIGNLLFLSAYIYFYPTVKASQIKDMTQRRIDIPHLTMEHGVKLLKVIHE